VRMVLPGETVEAEVRLTGQRLKMNLPQPGFSTVPFTGDSAAYFTVYTYFGHYHQDATGHWRAQGSGTFTNALSIPGESNAFKTNFEDGWQARSGLYKFAR
jgi:hemolysin activation/secretion protein